jgi:S1-C subfamily serine protease
VNVQIVLAPALALLLAACSTPTSAAPTSAQQASRAAAAPVAQTNPAGQRTSNGTVADNNPAIGVYAQQGASVVNITSIAVVPTRQGQVTQPQGIGSGFMLDSDGRIVTNNHVVQDADQLSVTLQDRSTVPAKLVGRDPDNDLAVIQVDPNATDDQGRAINSRLKPVTLANSDDVVVGQTAIAVGSPLGLAQTVTEGIVSAKRNPGDTAQGATQLDLIGGAIQTDAAINPGNSGGPLFDAGGQVVGVNSAILSQSGGNEGIGFAIPSNTVKRVVPELIQTGQYRHPYIGITAIPLTIIGNAARQQLGLSPTDKGLLVIDSSGPAAQAGIQGGSRPVVINGEQIPAGGDIIVAVDGQPVTTAGELRAYIENNRHPGDTVTVTIIRGGQRQDVQVTLGERPPTTPTPVPGP